METVLAAIGVIAALCIVGLDASGTRMLYIDSIVGLGQTIGAWALVFLPAAMVGIVARWTARRRGAHPTLAPIVSGAIVAALLTALIRIGS
jgi:hypothetical protein